MGEDTDTNPNIFLEPIISMAALMVLLIPLTTILWTLRICLWGWLVQIPTVITVDGVDIANTTATGVAAVITDLTA